jgi:segregation and condensation protein A
MAALCYLKQDFMMRRSLSPEGVDLAYTVRLDLFEGPLDLLLYLIRKEEIEITDIPIALITDQYLAHLDQMGTHELDGAGEYLVMAATLLRIKSRILLPRPGDPEEEDPRRELVQQLLEYRKYKEIAGRMETLARERTQMHDFVPDTPLEELRSTEEVFELDYTELMGALKSVMERVAERESRHRVALEDVTIEDKLALVRGKLREEGRFLFRDFFSQARTRLHLVVTFMALLELMRMGEARAFQLSNFGEIWIAAQQPQGSEAAAQAAHA